MPGVKTWLLDFDETLASSGITWAFKDAIPKFAREHQMTYEEKHLASAMLVMQERASQTYDVDSLLHEFFELMNWTHDAQRQLLDDLWSNYRPTLFDDAKPFLERLKYSQQRVFVVSNNQRTPEQLKILGIDAYVQGVFTPDSCPNTQPKPHPSLWEYIAAQEADIDPPSTVVVGDDPWSDGKFADACKLTCWIIDRMNRFTDMRSQTPYFWVHSLSDIPV